MHSSLVTVLRFFFDGLLILKSRITHRVDIRLSPLSLNRFCALYDNWYLSLDADMNAEEIRFLYNSHKNSLCPDCLILSEIAEHPNTPLDILDELSQQINFSILLSLATNPNIRQNIIDKLIETENINIYEHLISNVCISKEIKGNLTKKLEKD